MILTHFLELFVTLQHPLRQGSPGSKMLDLCEKKLSESPETFRIDATGELTNVAEYEHDPTSLTCFLIPKTCIFDGFYCFSIHGIPTHLGQVGSYGTQNLTLFSKVTELISKIGFSIDSGIFVSQRYNVILTVIGKNKEVRKTF